MSDVDAVRTLARAARLLERASGELSLAHYRVLAAVAAGTERASHVAARLALGKPTVSASVDALCRRGLLARHDVAGDHRAASLTLTREGAQVLARTERAMRDRLAEVLARTEDADGVLDALARLGAAMDTQPADRDASAQLAHASARTPSARTAPVRSSPPHGAPARSTR